MKFAPKGRTVLAAHPAPLPDEVLHCLRLPVRSDMLLRCPALAASTNSAT
ncbi:hypothetical protein ACFC4G_38090 [Streptomyces sp. NPDC056002]